MVNSPRGMKARFGSSSNPAALSDAWTQAGRAESTGKARDAVLTEQNVIGRKQEGRLGCDARDLADKRKRVLFVRDEHADMNGYVYQESHVLFMIVLGLPQGASHRLLERTRGGRRVR